MLISVDIRLVPFIKKKNIVVQICSFGKLDVCLFLDLFV